MEFSIENEFCSIVDAARQSMQELLDQPDTEINSRHESALNRFSELAATDKQLEHLGEIARSVAVLLSGNRSKFLDKRTYLQILAVGPRFLEALNQTGQIVESYSGSSLVVPVTPTSSNIRKALLVYTNNEGFWILLNTVAQHDGFMPQRIRSFDLIIQQDKIIQPVAIIVDIDLVIDPAELNNLMALKNYFNNSTHIFIIGDLANFDTRLFSVRIGATRFFSKPPDVRKMVSVLKGVTVKEPSQKYRVMLVDDDSSMATIYEAALLKSGFITLLIANPLEAMQAIKEFQPDVIVSDLLMTGCNGLEFLSMIRQDDSLLDTPVIVMTSDNDPERKVEALHLGADNYLVKPVALPLLCATITAHANKARRLKRSRFDLHEIFIRLKKGECSTCGKRPPELDLI